MATNRGAVYVAYGRAARKEARLSIESLKGQMPKLHISCMADRPVAGARWIEWKSLDEGGRWAKVNLDIVSPYNQTLYIDADTRIYESLETGFQILDDGWDLVITPSNRQGSDWLWHCSEEDRETTLQHIGCKGLQLQGGLFWFRNNAAVIEFFKCWRTEWLRFKEQDQGALLRALHDHPIRIWIMGHQWNGGTIVAHRFGSARS